MKNDDDIDSGEELTGGYGGDPEAEEDRDDSVPARHGSTEADDLGSTSLDSGVTAGGTDTGVSGSTGSIGGYSDTNLADVERPDSF